MLCMGCTYIKFFVSLSIARAEFLTEMTVTQISEWKISQVFLCCSPTVHFVLLYM